MEVIEGSVLTNMNITYNYDDYNDTDTNCCGVVCDQETSMHFEAIFIPILYSVAFVLGLMGNGLVLVVLCQKRRTWNVTDVFVLHLSVADMLLLLTLPLWAADAATGEIFNTGFCKFSGVVFRVNFYCSIFLLACISLDRYFSVVHAVQMYSRTRPKQVQLSCLAVWFFCLFFPFLTGSTWKPNMTLDESGSQGVQKQRAVRVVLALVMAFFISWTPYNITLMVDTLYTNQSSNNSITCEATAALDIALTATSTLGYMHCCVNPVLYAFVGVKFRRHLLDLIKPFRYRLQNRVDTVSRRSSVWSADTSQTSAF